MVPSISTNSHPGLTITQPRSLMPYCLREIWSAVQWVEKSLQRVDYFTLEPVLFKLLPLNFPNLPRFQD